MMAESNVTHCLSLYPTLGMGETEMEEEMSAVPHCDGCVLGPEILLPMGCVKLGN